MASPTLQFKRGLVVNLPALRAGEPGFTTDKNDFYIGGAGGNKFFGSHRYWTKEDGSNALKLNLVDKNGSNSLAVKAPDTLANSNTVYTLPAAPTDGYFLKTNSSGILEWASVTSGASFDSVNINNSTFTGVSTFSGSINSTGGASFSNLNVSGIGTIGTADINGGTIDGAVIGGSSAAAGTFTQLNYSNSSTSGVSTVGSLYVGTSKVLSTEGGNLTLSNIAAIDATTKATLEASLAFDPNNFDSLNVSGVSTLTGMVYANGGITGNLTGVASTATKLQTARNFEISGDVVATAVSFDGTGNVNLVATIQPNSVELGSDTTGNYVATISGTANEIEVSGSGSETASVTVGLPDAVTVTTSLSTPTVKTGAVQAADGTAAITITNATGAVGVSSNLTVSGNLYVNGTTTQVNTTSLTIEDTLVDLGLVDGAAPVADLNKDLGLLFNYYSGSAKKAAVYWSDSAGRIAFASDASESASVITATTYATILAGGLEVNNACTGGTATVISCVGSELALSNIVFDGGTF